MSSTSSNMQDLSDVSNIDLSKKSPVLLSQYNSLRNLVQQDYNRHRSTYNTIHNIQTATGIWNYTGDPISLASILAPNLLDSVPWYIPIIIQSVNLVGTYIDGYIRHVSNSKKEIMNKTMDLLQDIDREMRGNASGESYDRILDRYQSL